MPPQLPEGSNNNYINYNGNCNNYNYGLISNSSLARFNKTSYIDDSFIPEIGVSIKNPIVYQGSRSEEHTSELQSR